MSGGRGQAGKRQIGSGKWEMEGNEARLAEPHCRRRLETLWRHP